MWDGLRVWVEEVRRIRSHERLGERFQWLAERVQEYDARVSSETAYRRYADREPRE
jgi:hypothetical protein